mmetsp:Transcript_27529/g.69681  ORF Transcript_27529/g.69681 Transcript_27529/m.69681 type:complete len:216 (+) Transcript_27529:1195-1842(+)
MTCSPALYLSSVAFSSSAPMAFASGACSLCGSCATWPSTRLDSCPSTPSCSATALRQRLIASKVCSTSENWSRGEELAGKNWYALVPAPTTISMPPSSFLSVNVSRSTSETVLYATTSSWRRPKTLATKPTAVSKTYSVPCDLRFAGVIIVHWVMHAMCSVSGMPSRLRILSSFLAESELAGFSCWARPRGASRMSAVVFDTFCSRCDTVIAICL